MSELRERLRSIDPARPVPADEALLARVALVPRAAARPVHRRRRVALLGVAAAVTAVALIAPVVSLDSTPRATAEAVTVLDEAIAAIRANGVSDPVPAPGDYWLVHTIGIYPSDGPDGLRMQKQDRREWHPAIGAGATYFQTHGDPVSESSDHVWMDPAGLYEASWQVPTVEWLATLPRDPAALRERVYGDSAGQGNSADGEVLVFVADVLRGGLVPTDLRIALYQVLQTVPGVTVSQDTVGVGGRTGIALSRTESYDGVLQEIIIDPQTGDFLGKRYLLNGEPWGTSWVVERTLVHEVPADVVASAVVTELDGEYYAQ